MPRNTERLAREQAGLNDLLRRDASQAYHRFVRKRSLKIALAGMLVMCATTCFAATPASTSPSVQMAIDQAPAADDAIAKLGDSDPLVRRHASEALVQIGASARAAVLAASKGDDPQIAEGAQQVLRLLPWSIATDPPEVRELLKPYGQSAVAVREGIVGQLANLFPQSAPAMLRLLRDELNEDICWQIDAQFIDRPDVSIVAARQFTLQSSRPAALLLAARAWMIPSSDGKTAISVDHAKALAMLLRAIELESITPTYDDGQLDFAFDQTVADAVDRQDYLAAADLRRRQCKRIGVTRSSFPGPFFELLLLHSTFGPLPGFAKDMDEYQRFLSAPESLFILGRLYDRLGQHVLAATFAQAALAASTSVQTQSNAATFLLEQGLTDEATRECRAVLSRGNAQPDLNDVNARLKLSSLAVTRGDESQAAEQLRMALEDHKTSGGELTATHSDRIVSGAEAEQAMQIEVAQHALRAAEAKGDVAEANRQIDRLISLGPADYEAALDLVPELKNRGRAPEAKKMFQTVYAPLEAKIKNGESDPSLLNEVAWLCARCGENIDEAIDLSNRAVAAMPDSAAFLDTNADAHFRKGEAKEAVRLETLALVQEPHDQFMKSQLKRFTAAASSQPAPASPTGK